MLVKKEVKRVKNLPKGGLTLIMGQKGGQKGQESYHSDRAWVKKEVKMGQKSYQKGGLTQNGSKRRSKRVKDQRELLMISNEKFKKLVPEAEPGPRTPDSPYPLGSTINSQTPCRVGPL